jgi:hypothetical protein
MLYMDVSCGISGIISRNFRNNFGSGISGISGRISLVLGAHMPLPKSSFVAALLLAYDMLDA